jgi:hypothetical protein
MLVPFSTPTAVAVIKLICSPPWGPTVSDGQPQSDWSAHSLSAGAGIIFTAASQHLERQGEQTQSR